MRIHGVFMEIQQKVEFPFSWHFHGIFMSDTRGKVMVHAFWPFSGICEHHNFMCFMCFIDHECSRHTMSNGAQGPPMRAMRGKRHRPHSASHCLASGGVVARIGSNELVMAMPSANGDVSCAIGGGGGGSAHGGSTTPPACTSSAHPPGPQFAQSSL